MREHLNILWEKFKAWVLELYFVDEFILPRFEKEPPPPRIDLLRRIWEEHPELKKLVDAGYLD